MSDEARTMTTLNALDAAFAAATDGAGEVVVVEDLILDDAVARAAGAGLGTMHARGAGDERFALARDLFTPALDRLPAPERDAMLAGPASLASPVFERAPVPADVPEVSIVHGLYWLATNLADRGPLAILVGDTARGDRASLRLLRSIAQRVDELPIALVADGAVT